MNPGMRLPLATLAGALIGMAGALALAWGWHAFHGDQTELHALLHKAVPLDPDEQRQLDEKERQFVLRRSAIEARLRVANGQLANAIASDPEWSPKVEAASREVEQAAGDLQRITLEHIFEMRAGLKPEHRDAYDKVLVEALRRGSR
ncbi:periplasmic heavy metal sensor [Luteibacter aegosomatissinici]|uniref:periplasmic heavy metal sensor n=1 Tax=Luteibacter aegosomatissinici TaxID=2911539 RepID=UPI001FF969E6|nr:periplasmic heavy metal sensor [Luteibacter aegosomatissinici]UPG94301.1 periplasmic heavy metal sensor [Luteibacter aegosomatissinici]